MNGYYRTHPISIVFNLGRIFYLLFIPILRGLISAFRGGFAQWLMGAWMDILVFLVMLGIAALAWLNERFRYDGGHMELSYGLLNRRKILIPWERVAAVILTKPFFLRPFRAVRFRADTIGGSLRNADITILVSDKRARSIIDSRNLPADETPVNAYRPSTRSIAALSLLTSNSFGGILFISTFISQAGRLLGSGFSQMIIGTVEEAARSLAIVPPAAAAIAYVLLAGWFIGFFLLFCRYKNFTLVCGQGHLTISGGVFTKRKYYIRNSDVNFIDIRQSVTTRVLRIYSLYISAVGYGKRDDDISCVIPAETGPRFRESLRNTFPGMNPAPRRFAPGAKGIMRFVGSPVSCLLSEVAAITISLRMFPLWNGFIWFVGLMACVPAIMFIVVRVLDFRSAGLSFQDGRYTLRYSRGLSLHTVVIPADKVVGVKLRQGFFQKFGPYCDVIIASRAEGRSVHLCRSLVMDDMIKLFDLRMTGKKE